MSPSRKAARTGVAITALALVPLTMSGCFLFPPSAPVGGAVDFDGVQSATVQIQAEGTFVEPGSLEATPEGSRGSGFFVTPGGLVVTNNHVVTGAGTLKVWVGGDTKTTYGATVLGASECLDLAVLQVDGTDFPYFDWYEGDIDAALDVYSAGFPLGDPNFTLTKGIVSKADVPSEDAWASLDHVIEHDARIRGGNSGGPLVAENGQVVGVNYAGEDTLDYNFAIHRDQVLPVFEKLAAGEPVLSIGINAQALPPTTLDNGQQAAGGVWVASVKAGGPASNAGIEPGDIVSEMGGVWMSRRGTLQEYCEVIATQGEKATIPITVYRPSEGYAKYEGEINGRPLELVGGGGTEPTPPQPGGFTTVTDSTGTVSVEVPSSWNQVAGDPIQLGGVTMPSVTASPDIAGFTQTWGVPGVSVSATNDPSVTIDGYLANFDGLADQCAGSDPGDYDDGYYVGRYIYFEGCGGSADFLALAANDANGTHLALLTLQMVSEEDKSTNLEKILGSFIAAY